MQTSHLAVNGQHETKPMIFLENIHLYVCAFFFTLLIFFIPYYHFQVCVFMIFVCVYIYVSLHVYVVKFFSMCPDLFFLEKFIPLLVPSIHQ